MSSTPDKAFILAAGKGTRLRPYTDTMPKPMVEIAGRSIIKRTIEKLKDVGVKQIVINLHHLGDTLAQHLDDIREPNLIFSRETELLETGGGLKKGLAHFNNEPFYIINGDALWDDGKIPALQALADRWDESKMDILLLLQPVSAMQFGEAVGDYKLAKDGRATRAKNKDGDYMFAGIRIAYPRIFEGSPDGTFSFLELMDKAERENKLYAVAHDSNWYHISTPEDLETVDALFKKRGGG